MTQEELQKIYEELEVAAEQLRVMAEQMQATAKVLTEIRERLASGGGPADR